MKRLLLLRHAKAEPGDARDDFGRRLTPSGESDAEGIGDFMVDHALRPDLVVYSGARRTRETAEIILRRLGAGVESHETNALYDATRHLIVGLLRHLPDRNGVALVVGHNPGMSDLAYWLSDTGDRQMRQRVATKYPTCGLAVLEFDAPAWSGLAAHSARLQAFVTPADLGARQE